MLLLHLIPLVAIGVIWVVAWRCGWRWARACGVSEPVSAVALACILPTAGLIFSVHLLALGSLVLQRGWFTPASTCLVFALAVWLAHRLVPPSGDRTPGASPVTPDTSPGGGFVRGLAPAARRLCRLARCGFLWVPLAILAGMYTVFLIDALTRFPTGYDATTYHLPLAVSWMRQQNLNVNLGAIQDAFPDNGMIVLSLLVFSRLEWLFPIVHLPKGLLAAAAVFGLVRVCGYRRRTALIGACVTLSVPMVVFQCYSGYIDLYAAASWLSSLLALAWAARVPTARQRRWLLVMAGLSGGVALGSKTTFLVLVTLLGIVAIAVEWIRHRDDAQDRRRPALNAVLFGLAALVCSGFWFIRGTVQAGNPVYPLAVTIGRHEILPGYTADLYFRHRSVTTRLRRWWDYPWRETKYSGRGYPYGVNNALGAAYATFVVPGVLAALLGAGLRSGRDGGRMTRPQGGNPLRGSSAPHGLRLVVLLLTLSGPLLLLTVFHEMLRFVFPQILLGVVAASTMTEWIAGRCRRATVAVLSVSLLVTAAVATLKPVHAMAGAVKGGVWERASFYCIPKIVDDFPAGTRILNLAEPPSAYPLLGSHLTNEVIREMRWIAAHGEGPLSARALRESAIDYIYIRQPRPDHWPDDLPVDLVYDDSEQRKAEGMPASRLFRVRPVEGHGNRNQRSASLADR